MRTPTLTSVVPLLPLLAGTAQAVCGVHSFTACEDNIVHWFDPLTGEVCDPIDCGGGRAPPKTGPGCPGYTGTVVRSVSYLSCWTPSSATPPPTTLATSTAVVTLDETPSSTVTTTATLSDSNTATPTMVVTAQPNTPTLGSTEVTDGGSLTTPPATLPTVETTDAGASGTGGTTAQPQPTTNAGNLVDGPWRVALGAAIGGVIALV